MSGKGVLIDSVVFIDHFNGIEAATKYLRKTRKIGYVSPITVAEVLAGMRGKARRLARRFLDCYDFAGMDREIADLAAELRQAEGWKLPDAFQAAVARYNGLSLATRNTKDFNPDKYPFVVVPYPF
ncbi:MAG: PIN domain-containing protein [Deltaproteobacteria bacterium]|nr:PIN domain-containing protein [Deltaproteobacteria bacterium]